MSKKESKPVSKDKQIAQLKRELKAAKLREVNNARVFAYALDLYRPDPPNILGAKSTPAQELLTLAVKISDQHTNSRITVTASPDGTTSVSIEPIIQRLTIEEPEGIEKENPALDTEFWSREGRTFSATSYAKDKADKPSDPKIIKPTDGDEPTGEPAKEPAIKFTSRMGFSYSLAEILFLRNKPQGMTLREWQTVQLIQRNYLGTRALQKESEPVTITLNAPNAIDRLNKAFADAGFEAVADTVQAKLDVLNQQPYNRVTPKEIDTTFASLNAKDAIKKVSEALAEVADSPSELEIMQTELRKMGVST
ncbi:MAG TPA: hypothetical protein PLL06_00995 [Acidobacteriota bacterium]|nr:hypothetical protein [Acidobacteriota bacterium]HNG93599.1 hypothetical protein [Acidobacteriota bacterium]